MLYLDENCFCEPAFSEFEGDSSVGYETGLQGEVPGLFSFGECDEEVFGLFGDDSREYAYETDPEWGDAPLALDPGEAIACRKVDPGREREKRDRSVYGTGVEAQRLRAVNVKSPDLVLYRRAVQDVTGRINKPRLQELADAFRDRFNISIGRDGRRGLWSLWAFFKEQFPDPADFVDFIQ